MLHAHICYGMATNRVREAPAVRVKRPYWRQRGAADRDGVSLQEDDRYATHLSGELLGGRQS